MNESINARDYASYTYFESVTLRFSDHDGMDHVNNAAFVTLFEVPRVNLIGSVLTGDHIDTVLARICVDFVKETRYPGTLEVGARVVSIGNKSFRSVYAIFRDGECLATADCVNVFFDTNIRQATAPSAQIRANLEALLADGR